MGRSAVLIKSGIRRSATGAGNLEGEMENIGIFLGGLILGIALGCLLMMFLMGASDYYKGGDDFDDHKMA